MKEPLFVRKAAFILALLLIVPVLLTSQGRKALDIYFIDVEGGLATLYVAPSGESIVIRSSMGISKSGP